MSEDESLRRLVLDLAEADPADHGGASTDGAGSRTQSGPTLWDRLEEAGLASIGVAESVGGSGGTIDDLVTVVAALGEAGVGVPIIEVATARWLLAQLDRDAQPLATVLTGDPLPVGDEVVFRSAPWAEGTAIVLAYRSDTTVSVVDAHDEGVRIEAARNAASDPQARIALAASTAAVEVSAPTREAVRMRCALLNVAAMCGAIRGAYSLTRDYVRVREQFGAPLIALPAVSTKLARIRTQSLLAEASLAAALDAYSAADPRDAGELHAAIAPARVVTAQAATEVAQLTHQLHGAMGVTREYPLHHRTTRLWAWRDAGGTQSEWAVGLGERSLTDGEAGVWALTTTGGPKQ